MADQKGKVELAQDGGGDHGGVSRLGGGGVGVRRLGGVLDAVGAVDARAPVRRDGGGVRGGRGRGGRDRVAGGADTFLGGEQRGRDRGRLAVGRDEVVGDVLDEEAFALLAGK